MASISKTNRARIEASEAIPSETLQSFLFSVPGDLRRQHIGPVSFAVSHKVDIETEISRLRGRGMAELARWGTMAWRLADSRSRTFGSDYIKNIGLRRSNEADICGE